MFNLMPLGYRVIHISKTVIIFSLKIWLSPSSLTVDVTSMAVKDQLDKTKSFLHFFISNFHETSFFMIYFDNLMTNLGEECEKDRYNKI